MLTSIFNLYYVGFLDQFQEILGWNFINKVIRTCYFHASRLVEFVSDELMRFLYISLYLRGLLLLWTQLSIDHSSFVRLPLSSNSSSRSRKQVMISGLQHVLIFFEMSFDFHEFVNAYHLGDTVAIESGYQKHVPVWQAMNQHK